jgi:hypothetical protein
MSIVLAKTTSQIIVEYELLNITINLLIIDLLRNCGALLGVQHDLI